MLSGDTDYRDIGADHFIRRDPQRERRRAIATLNKLGYTVTLNPIEPPRPPPDTSNQSNPPPILWSHTGPHTGDSPADHTRPHTRSWSGSADRRRVAIFEPGAGDQLWVLLVGDGPYARRAAARQLATDVVAVLPGDPVSARVLSGGGTLRTRRPLLQAAAAAETPVRRLIDSRRARLAVPVLERGHA